MTAVQGYFDGMSVRLLEKITAKPNQRLIITVMDEFVDTTKPIQRKGMRGALAQYADPALAEKEKGAWEHAVVEKYGHV